MRNRAAKAARRELAHNAMLDRAYEAAAHRQMTASDIEWERLDHRIAEALERSRVADERVRVWIEGRVK